MAHLHVKTPNGTAYSIDLDAASQIGSIPSSGNNGWGVLTNGAIIQWGQFNAGLSVADTVQSWPIEFTNACFAACATTTPSTAEGGDAVTVSKTGIILDPYSYSHPYAYVIAIGQ